MASEAKKSSKHNVMAKFDEQAMFGAGGAADVVAEDVEQSKSKKTRRQNDGFEDPEHLKIHEELRRRERSVFKNKRRLAINDKTGIAVGKEGVSGLPELCMQIDLNEHKALLTDMCVVSSTTREKAEMKYTKRIEDLLIEMSSVESNLEREKDKQSRIDDHIRTMERQIQAARMQKAQLKKTQLPFQNHDLTSKQLQKKSRVLENRLHLESSKFNLLLSENELLREKIVTLKQEKKKFVHQKQQLQSEFIGNKDKSAAYVTKAIAWHEHIKETIKKRDFLMRDFKDILSRFKSEEIELERQILNQRSENVFQGGKITDRTSAWKEKRERERQEIAKMDKARAAKLSSLETAWNKLSALTLQNMVTLRPGLGQTKRKSLTSFEKSKEDIREDIVGRFKYAEEANFELFELCNFQTEELKKLKEKLERATEKSHDLTIEATGAQYESGAQLFTVNRTIEDLAFDHEVASESHNMNIKALDDLDKGVSELMGRLRVNFGELDLPFKKDSDKNELEDYGKYFGCLEDQINQHLRLKLNMTCYDNISLNSIDETTEFSELAEDILGHEKAPSPIDYPLVTSAPSTLHTAGRRGKAETLLGGLTDRDDQSIQTEDHDDLESFHIPDGELLDQEKLEERALTTISRKEKIEQHRRDAKQAMQMHKLTPGAHGHGVSVLRTATSVLRPGGGHAVSVMRPGRPHGVSVIRHNSPKKGGGASRSTRGPGM